MFLSPIIAQHNYIYLQIFAGRNGVLGAAFFPRILTVAGAFCIKFSCNRARFFEALPGVLDGEKIAGWVTAAEGRSKSITLIIFAELAGVAAANTVSQNSTKKRVGGTCFNYYG